MTKLWPCFEFNIYLFFYSLFGSNMHTAYGNGMPMTQQQQQQQQPGQQQQQQQQPASAKMSATSPAPGGGGSNPSGSYNSYFGQLQTDNVMCRPVH